MILLKDLMNAIASDPNDNQDFIVSVKDITKRDLERLNKVVVQVNITGCTSRNANLTRLQDAVHEYEGTTGIDISGLEVVFQFIVDSKRPVGSDIPLFRRLNEESFDVASPTFSRTLYAVIESMRSADKLSIEGSFDRVAVGVFREPSSGFSNPDTIIEFAFKDLIAVGEGYHYLMRVNETSYGTVSQDFLNRFLAMTARLIANRRSR